MRIGILGHGFVEWGGGVHFLRLICASLHASGAPVELHLLLPSRGPRLAAREGLRYLRSSVSRMMGRNSAPPLKVPMASIEEDMAHTGAPVRIHAIDFGPAAVARAHRQLGLDVLLPSIHPLPFGPEIRWVGYLADFQHRHLPQHFSLQERQARDLAFGKMLRDAKAVIVNARSVAADAQAFHPGSPARIFALPFAAAPADNWFELDAPRTRERYGVVPPYFIVCNQFWKHKDHATALDAFSIVARRRPDVQLVCTGATTDYRDPEHFELLMQRAKQAGIYDRVKVLGLVPKQDQIALLRGATALVQPTRFEGGPGGGAVYDAVSVGVRSLVSDIPVNRELDAEPLVRFFRVGEPEHLAEAMLDTLEAAVPGAAPGKLIEQALARRKLCGLRLLEAIAATAA